jgi:hypothetical protein
VKNPINNNSPTIPNSIPTPNPNKISVYIMSSDSGKLYMRDKDGNYWDAGLAVDCPAISSDFNTIVIDDVYSIYNKKNLPDKYKDYPGCKNVSNNSYCAVMTQTKTEYENYIQKNTKGVYKPNPITCDIGSKGGSPSTDFGKLLLSQLKNFGKSILDFFTENKEELEQIATQLSPIIAVSYVFSKYAETQILTPFVAPFFIMLQSADINNPKAEEQPAIQSSFMLFKAGIDKLSNILSKNSGLSLENTTSGELADASIEAATDAAVEVSVAMSISTTALNTIAFAAGGVEIVMMAGMILDVIDPCGLSKGFIDQDIMDRIKSSFDKSLYNQTNGNSYPTIWNAEFNCEYQLNPNIYWNQCMTPEQQSKISLDDFTKDFNDTIKKYKNEYLGSLKVNSQGQCLKSLTNIELQHFLEQLVPNVNWSQIGSMTNTDIKKIKLPMNNTLRTIDLLFTDNNVIVASYLDKYWYLVLLFIMVLILVIIFV